MSLALVCLCLTDLAVPSGGNIQAAINQAQNGDRVLVQPGTYAQRVRFFGKAIELIGLGGAGATTLDGTALVGGDPLVSFHDHEGPASVLQGFTITGGKNLSGQAGSAAAISCRILQSTAASATPTIRDCVIRNNESQQTTAAIGGDPLLERCVIRDNKNLYLGGAAFGAPTLRHCVITDNESLDGGGLYVTGPSSAVGGTATVEDCVFARNKAVDSGHGGAIYVQAKSAVSVKRTLITQNVADGLGLVAGSGGALHVQANATATLDRCTIVGNIQTPVCSIFPCLPGKAGIVGNVTLSNSILRDHEGADDYTAASGISYCNVQGGAPGVGNIDVPVDYIIPGSDYHLAANTAGIDAGDPTQTDPDGSRVDMGAFAYATLYTRSDVTMTEASSPCFAQLSAQVGGKQVLRFQADPLYAHFPYVVAGSFAGTSPGLSLQGQPIPLNLDFYFNYTLAFPNTFPLTNSLGTLSAQARADITFTLPPGLASVFAPHTVNHAAVVLHPSGTLFQVSNAAPLALVP